MSEAANLIRKLESSKSMQKAMGDYYARLLAADKSRNPKIAWCSSVGPAELLYAMGFEVYFPENHAAMIGAGKNAADYIPVAVAQGYSPDICSYLTSDIGAFLKGETPLSRFGFSSLPKPDILVFNTNQCREVQDWLGFYARHYGVPMIGIHTPMGLNELSPDTVAYVSAQFRNLCPRIEAAVGGRFDIDRFRETVRLSKEACVLWRRVLETAQHKPSPLNFFDACIHMGPVVVMRGTQAAVDYYRELLAELEGRIQSGTGAIPQERYRLYWEGMPLWFQISGMAKLLARLNACVVASTYCNSWVFDDLDPAEPFDSCALAYSNLFISRSDEAKEKALEDLFERFSVDGILYHDAKTCPRNSNNRYGLHVRMHQKTRLPYLEIAGDLNDSRCFSQEQSVTAIETFAGQLAMARSR